MATDVKNPYFSNLFNAFGVYMNSGSIGGNLETKNGATNDRFSKFTAGNKSNSAFINIAGNYKYTCIIPKDPSQPPNYIGILKENNALDDSFMDELFSFTDNATADGIKIDCTRAAGGLYSKLYNADSKRTTSNGKQETTENLEKEPQAYCINFTDGMPFDIYESEKRDVHKEISKQLNSIIDYAIATGQTAESNVYDTTLINNFLNIFFTEGGIPRYYALRTGILPSAIAYARYLQSNKGGNFSQYYNGFMTELDYLKQGSHFIPIGRSEQFLNSATDRLFWYPFNSKSPYSYKYDTSGGTTDSQQYVVSNGFNHYNLDDNTNDKAQAKALEVLINAINVNTPAIDATLSGTNKTILSYKSCLSDIPAPNSILVLDSHNKLVDVKIGNTVEQRYKGNLSQSITKIERWANINANGTIEMHPLLNYSGYKNEYLNVKAEQYEPTDSNLEELSYYNSGFTFTEASKALHRMNFYSSKDNVKSVDPYALEFGAISRDLYTVTNGSTELNINKKQTINPSAFGVLGKIPEGDTAWKTIKCGITETINKVDQLKNNNYLFTVKNSENGNAVPAVEMNITTLHYGDPHGGEGDDSHGCNFYNDDSFGGGYDCHKVYYLDTGEDYHERNYNKSMPKAEFNEAVKVKVAFDRNKEAMLGEYNAGTVYNLSNVTMNADSIQGYYYTVHILAEDGQISTNITINPSNGTIKEPSEKWAKCYGTGLQYFFGGNCDESIFKSYYDRGLTLYQLLDPTTDIYLSKPNGYGRVRNGLQYANRTFEWDYNIVLKAWNLALWIMRGSPTETTFKNYKNIDVSVLYKTKDAGLALASFFNYIYKTNKIKLVLGPSLKQINNAVGPYGSNSNNDGTKSDPKNLIDKYGKKGVAQNKEYDNKTLRGAAWNAIRDNNTSSSYYNGLKDHAKVAAAVFVNKDSNLYTGSETKIGKNGVGRKYWSKGYTAGTGYNDKSDRSEWGWHWADARRTAKHSEGRLHLDHYSWAWHIENTINNATELFAPTLHQNNRWHGAFMIHARKLSDKEGYNAPFNWHLGPFHEVSPEARVHTNEYGVRNQLVKWRQNYEDGSRRSQQWNGPDADGGCSQGAPDTTWKQAWDGINGDWTWDHQNPNIRIRLPMLWRYLKSLREMSIYTDGQLMPCGIELHYCSYKKSLMTSITNTEHSLPISTGIAVDVNNNGEMNTKNVDPKELTSDNKNSWQKAIKSPSSITFAEVLYDTYAITKNTISTWYSFLKQPENCTPLIKDILATVSRQSDKITAMYTPDLLAE